MPPDIHWASGPWRGKLGIGARPRGDDWLAEDIERWRGQGIDVILSLLTVEEQRDLGLLNEANVAKTHGITFVSLPIGDMQIPRSRQPLAGVLQMISAELSSGRNVFIHCRQGIGRTGLVAACLLVKAGWTPENAMKHLTNVRGLPVPQTEEQREWVLDFSKDEER